MRFVSLLLLSRHNLRNKIQPYTLVKMSDTKTFIEDDVRSTKRALRKEIRGRLKALTPELIQEQSLQVWSHLFQMKDYKEAKSISVFLSMATEISTESLLLDACRRGKTIYVPQVGKNFEQADMEMIRIPYDTRSEELFYKSWPRNKWNIPEPPSEMVLELAKPGDIDLIVIPGLAFDRKGDRLGQGKGYYDRFIARFSESKPTLVAVALACQQVDAIPVGPYDQSMDHVIFPDRVITIDKN